MWSCKLQATEIDRGNCDLAEATCQDPFELMLKDMMGKKRKRKKYAWQIALEREQKRLRNRPWNPAVIKFPFDPSLPDTTIESYLIGLDLIGGGKSRIWQMRPTQSSS